MTAIPAGHRRRVLLAVGRAQDVADPDSDADWCAISTVASWIEGCATGRDARAACAEALAAVGERLKRGEP